MSDYKQVKYASYHIKCKSHNNKIVCVAMTDMYKLTDAYGIGAKIPTKPRCMFANNAENWPELSEADFLDVQMFGESLTKWMELKQLPTDKRERSVIDASFFTATNRILQDAKSKIRLNNNVVEWNLYYSDAAVLPKDPMKATYYTLVGYQRAVK